MHQPNVDQARLRRMEGILSGLLRYGALFACVVLLLGMVLSATGPMLTSQALSGTGRYCLAGGIIFLITLPVLRVAIMAIIFLVERDYRFAAISVAVLLIISVGFALGTIHASAAVP